MNKTFYIAIDSVERFPKLDMRYWETEPEPEEVKGMASWSKTYPRLRNTRVVFYVPGQKISQKQKKAAEMVAMTFVRSRL